MKYLEGKIIENKRYQDGTFIVEVTRTKTHPLYKKVISFKKKYVVNGPRKAIEMNTVVQIKQCRPLSKLKRYAIVEEEVQNAN